MLWEFMRDQMIKSGKKIFMNANAYEYQYLEDENFGGLNVKLIMKIMKLIANKS